MTGSSECSSESVSLRYFNLSGKEIFRNIVPGIGAQILTCAGSFQMFFFFRGASSSAILYTRYRRVATRISMGQDSEYYIWQGPLLVMGLI